MYIYIYIYIYIYNVLAPAIYSQLTITISKDDLSAKTVYPYKQRQLITMSKDSCFITMSKDGLSL